MKTLNRWTLWLAATLLMSGAAMARGHGERMFYDTHYHHNHYYPARGHVSVGLPVGAIRVGFGHDRYWFHGGAWYRPHGSSFRVIMPPLGIVIPVLPSAYVSLRVGGLPYYYANGVYYTQTVPGPGYTVVAPPQEGAVVQATPVAPVLSPAAPAKPDPVIYPRNGQSPAQTEADRQDCNRWATTQPAAMNDALVFNRSVEACMDGRGYSMR